MLDVAAELGVSVSSTQHNLVKSLRTHIRAYVEPVSALVKNPELYEQLRKQVGVGMLKYAYLYQQVGKQQVDVHMILAMWRYLVAALYPYCQLLSVIMTCRLAGRRVALSQRVVWSQAAQVKLPL